MNVPVSTSGIHELRGDILYKEVYQPPTALAEIEHDRRGFSQIHRALKQSPFRYNQMRHALCIVSYLN
jgi:hypothetical protein